jgi:Ca2+/Na+ antiporter
MQKLFNYFFTIQPGFEMNYYIPLFIISGSIIIFSIIFAFSYKKLKKKNIAFKRNFKSVSKLALLLGVSLLFTTLMRYENIPYFSMRIWLYSICFLILYTAFYYFKTFKYKYLKEINSSIKKEDKEIKKYSTAKKKR